MGRALARLPAATDATGVPRTTTEEARVAAAIRIASGECLLAPSELEGRLPTAAF